MEYSLNSFYHALWGDSGQYRSIWYGEKGAAPTRHKWFTSSAQAISFLDSLDTDKFNIYHACSLFSKKLRQQAHVASVKAVWIDLDLKGTTLTSLKEVLMQLKFLAGTPFESGYWVVATGHGFHIYWMFEESLSPSEWVSTAGYLFSVLREKLIQFDPVRLRDSASIMRVIGTNNLKDSPTPIKLLKEGNLLKKIDVPAQYVVTKIVLVPKVKYNKDDFEATNNLATFNYLKSDIILVNKKCDVMRHFSVTGFVNNEPAWYAALAVCLHCIDGEQYAHEFSAKDASYDETVTARKIQQLKEKAIGPTLCERFAALGFCSNCPYIEKIKSPIQLGTVITPLDNVAEELSTKKEVDRAKELIKLAPKEGWKVGKEGVYRLIDDIPVPVTLSPFYIIDLVCEDTHDLTIVTAVLRFYLNSKPHHFKLPLKLLADDKKLLAEFTSRRLFPANKKHLREYISAYAVNLSHVKPQKTVTSLGWQADDSFVYSVSGDAWDKNGNPVVCVLDKKMVSYAIGFEQKGTIEAWQKAVKMFDGNPIFYPHLFSLLCSAGSVLLPFTSAKGFLLSLQGCSGCGKTLSHKMALSVWGNAENAGVLGTYDTATARLGRMATVKNMPLRLDEITTMKPQQLTGLVFELVNGRGRGRATVDGTLSNTAADWQTVTFVTTNKPMLESEISVISEAERCRILELAVTMPEDIQIMQKAGKLIEDNYGLVGKEIVKWVMGNKETVVKTINSFQEKFQAMVGDDKRFWVSCGAIAFTAATILKKLNLLDINYKALMEYFVAIITTQDTKNERELTAVRGFETLEELSHALYDSLSGFVVTLDLDMNVIRAPEKEIKARLVHDHLTGEMTLYVRLKPVKDFINANFTDSYKAILKKFDIDKDKPQRFKDVVMRCYEFKLASGDKQRDKQH